jgi:uncharacterized protein YndB with AHSA1/START domain
MAGTTPDDPDEYGRLEEADGRWRLRFTRRLPHPPATVWPALTEPRHLEAWFPTTIEGERSAGAPLHFAFRGGEAAPFDGEMLVYDPPSVMEFRWGPDTLRFELHPDGDGCRLVLLDILDERGKAARDGAGWHVCLDALGEHLAGERSEQDTSERWRPLNAAYADRFGPEAATIGPPSAGSV